MSRKPPLDAKVVSAIPPLASLSVVDDVGPIHHHRIKSFYLNLGSADPLGITHQAKSFGSCKSKANLIMTENATKLWYLARSLLEKKGHKNLIFSVLYGEFFLTLTLIAKVSKNILAWAWDENAVGEKKHEKGSISGVNGTEEAGLGCIQRRRHYWLGRWEKRDVVANVVPRARHKTWLKWVWKKWWKRKHSGKQRPLFATVSKATFSYPSVPNWSKNRWWEKICPSSINNTPSFFPFQFGLFELNDDFRLGSRKRKLLYKHIFYTSEHFWRWK